MRALRILLVGVGNVVPSAKELRLFGERKLCSVRHWGGGLCGTNAQGLVLCRRSANSLCRGHYIQRIERNRNATRRVGGNIRSRRTRPYSDSVRQGDGVARGCSGFGSGEDGAGA